MSYLYPFPLYKRYAFRIIILKTKLINIHNNNNNNPADIQLATNFY